MDLKRIVTSAFFVASAYAQFSGGPATTVDLSKQTKNVDFSAAPLTKPIRSVSSLPGTCSVSELAYLSTATAGQNLYACTSTNTWTLQAGGGGGSSLSGLTTGALMAAASSSSAQTPNANATLDSSGNLSATSFSTPSSAAAGYFQCTAGTAPTAVSSAIQIACPSAATQTQWILPSTPATGIPLMTNSGGVVTWSTMTGMTVPNALIMDNGAGGVIDASGTVGTANNTVLQLNANGGGGASPDSLVFSNTTAATSLAPNQNPGQMHFTGQVWNGTASVQQELLWQMAQTSGGNPVASINISYRQGGSGGFGSPYFQWQIDPGNTVTQYIINAAYAPVMNFVTGGDNWQIGQNSKGLGGFSIGHSSDAGCDVFNVGATTADSTSIGPCYGGATGTLDVKNNIASTGTTRVNFRLGAADSNTTNIFNLEGVMKFGGANSTAAVAGVIGSTCPAVTCTAAYTWVRAVSADGSTVYFPVWK